MMKLGTRLVVGTVCVVAVVFLLIVLFKDMNYARLLENRWKMEDKLSSKSPEDILDVPVKALTAGTEVKVTGKKTIPTTVTKPRRRRRNLFGDLDKYSVNNPNYRLHMEWPPFFTVPPFNPILADVWELDITPDLPNWEIFNYQISKFQLYEENSTVIEGLLHDMATQKIIAVEQYGGGMQFHLLITFEDSGMALFKPMRFPKGQDIHRNILYMSDFERHHSEIAAYHLDRILGFRRVPPVVGRKVNVTGEIYRLADQDFYPTFYISPGGNYCFHGKCEMYCDTHHGFCGDPFMLEGSFSAWIISDPPDLFGWSSLRSPWKRTYRTYEKRVWEVDNRFCFDTVIKYAPFDKDRRLYDIVDCAIFDFLIGNEDRHHYSEFKIFGQDNSSTLVHLDNGRGFGRADHDELSILTPLKQCCTLRLSTFNKIYSFHTGPRPLSDLMRESLSKDPLTPVLTEPHLKAMDRRVDKVLAMVQKCLVNNIPSLVLLNDML